MAWVVLLPPLSSEFFAGREELTVMGDTIFAIVRAVDAMAPGFAEAAEMRAAVAVNGQAVADWTTALDGNDEVMFVPKIAGG